MNGLVQNGDGISLATQPSTLVQSSGSIVWLVGLSGAGKTTISRSVLQALRHLGHRVHLLDADDLRKTICSDLGYSEADRLENVRRIAQLAASLAADGSTVIVAAITPYQASRDWLRSRLHPFIEIFVNAPLSLCETRDVKGLYGKARAGYLKNFTGIDAPFEVPLHPDLVCETSRETVQESASRVLRLIENNAE